MLSDDDRELLQSRIDLDDFEYTFIHYSDWKEIKDAEFHKLLSAYRAAHQKLRAYIDGESSN